MTGMTEEQARIRAEELRNIISENNRLYYVENSPKISDYDYDMLMNELIAIEKRFPVLATPDSPTMKVGSDLATGHDTRAGIKEFRQFPHRYPMLSLGNTYDITEDGVGAEVTEGRNLTAEMIETINGYKDQIANGEITVSTTRVIPNGEHGTVASFAEAE